RRSFALPRHLRTRVRSRHGSTHRTWPPKDHASLGASMIDALDHLVLRASFRAGAVGAYETLLGRQAQDGRLRVGNVGLTIEDHASTAQLSAMVFVTASLNKAKRLLERRAVPCERKDEQLVLSTIATHGVPIALVERAE